MLIYHISNNQLYCTEVIMGGAIKSKVSHFPKHLDLILSEHRDNVSKLENMGQVYVTGGTYKGAVYEGKFEDRARFHHYIGSME